jgi:hypothetical protein
MFDAAILYKAFPNTAVQNQSGNHTSVRIVFCVTPLDDRFDRIHVLSLPELIVPRRAPEHPVYDSLDADACYIWALARQLGSEPIRPVLDRTGYMTESP